jgi:precorrin-8X/cobalt-precorrin-8 methylmutase
VLDGDEPMLSNPATRRQAEREIAAVIDGGRRTLLAVDASLGYPVGSASWFGLDGGPPWRAMWHHLAHSLTDDDRNRNNRFEVAAELNRRRATAGPFWGRPPSAVIDGLGTRKPTEFPVPEFRHAERRLLDGGRRPASCWQLLGAGSVGGQTLTLLPVLERLRRAGAAEVWPFTTGCSVPVVTSGTVVAETWPTAYDLELPCDRVRDAAQVEGVARRLAEVDASGQLANWFEPDLDDAVRVGVECEEGWVLAPARCTHSAQEWCETKGGRPTGSENP